MIDRSMLTEAYIKAVAPGSGALSSARSLTGGFLDMRADEAASCIGASYLGHGSSPYRVSVRLAEPFRYACTCPSRQTPCKHVLGLMLAYAASPDGFQRLPLDEALAEPRRRRVSPPGASSGESAKNRLRLRGLRAAGALCEELLKVGAGQRDALLPLLEKGAVIRSCKLPEPYNRWRDIMHTLLAGGPDRYGLALDKLSRFYAALGRAGDYCAARLEDPACPVDLRLEAWMGASWSLSQLEAMGEATPDARLMQLSFEVSGNAPAGRTEEHSIWMELGTARLVRTVNLRPDAALSRTKETDSTQEVLTASRLCRYPVGRRVRWDSFSLRPALKEDYATLLRDAQAGGEPLKKAVKRGMIDLLDDAPPLAFVRFERIAGAGGGLVLIDGTGSGIDLTGVPEDVVRRLPPGRFEAALLRFERAHGGIAATPLCLAGREGLFRLRG